MGLQQREPPASVVAFAPKRADQERAEQERSVPADDVGNGIIALLHKAAEAAQGRLRASHEPRTQTFFSVARC